MKFLYFLTAILIGGCLTEIGHIRYEGILINSSSKNISLISYNKFSNNSGGLDFKNDTFFISTNQNLLIFNNLIKTEEKPIRKTSVLFGDSLKIVFNDSFIITHYGLEIPVGLKTPNYLLSSNRNALNKNNFTIQEMKNKNKILKRKMTFTFTEQDYLDAKQ